MAEHKIPPQSDAARARRASGLGLAVTQSGFTLVELIAVVMLAGVLAAVALPRLLDLRQNAQVAVMQKLAAEVASASNAVHLKAVIEDKAALGPDTLTLPGSAGAISLHSRFISGVWSLGIARAINLDASGNFTADGVVCSGHSFCGRGNWTGPNLGLPAGGEGVVVRPQGYRHADNCHVIYYNPNSGDSPTIRAVTSGC